LLQYVDPDELDQRAFSALAVILIIMSVVLLTYEIIFHLLMRETRDISDFIQLVYRVLLFVLTIVFVSGFANDCWCAPPWQWQIGALVMFMAFFNFVLLLKGLPWFGVPINMLLNIIAVFLRLVYLPILLILSFAFPFYMLFIRGGDADAGVLTAFSTFPFSLSKVVMQTAGELDYGNLFEEASLLYTPMAIILFVTFVVLMPVLFSNLLVGLAVGTAEEDTKKAELTNIRLQVEYIVQLENLRVVRHLAHLPQLNYSKEAKRNWFQAWKDKMTGVDYDTQAELVVELHVSLQDSDGGSKETVEEIKEKVTEMAALMESLQMSISVLQKSNRHLHETVKEVKETGIQNLQEQMNKILKKVS
jgi:transient receptor potential cation channel subfamily A protein 1